MRADGEGHGLPPLHGRPAVDGRALGDFSGDPGGVLLTANQAELHGAVLASKIHCMLSVAPGDGRLPLRWHCSHHQWSCAPGVVSRHRRPSRFQSTGNVELA